MPLTRRICQNLCQNPCPRAYALPPLQSKEKQWKVVCEWTGAVKGLHKNDSVFGKVPKSGKATSVVGSGSGDKGH